MKISLIGILLSQSIVIAQAHAIPPSVKQPYPRVNCSEWAQRSGFEGACTVETEKATWEAKYYREGNVRKDSKGRTKNLVVLFHPDGLSHKSYEWWADLVGLAKSIDTTKWLVLSISTLGDGFPKIGTPALLTGDEILNVQKAIVDQLYPNSEFIVGGPSRGGQLAISFSIRNRARVKKVFLVSAHGLKEPRMTPVLDALNTLDREERANGPYGSWSRIKKLEWWRKGVKGYVDMAYTEEYYGDPKWISDLELKREDYKDPGQFKELTIDNWTSFFVDTQDPRWFSAQLNALQIESDNTSKNSFTGFPEVLIVWNRRDLDFDPLDTEKFIKGLQEKGRKVQSVQVEDVRGHMACCSPEVPEKIKISLREFLD